MLPQAGFGLADQRGHVELEEQSGGIERRLAAVAAAAVRSRTRWRGHRTCLSPYKHALPIDDEGSGAMV
jgi:hypothetical protein